MKTCMQCGSAFPTTGVIDGKRRSFSSRKRCFDCSPFGEHNTTKIEYSEGDSECRECGRTYQYCKQKGHTRKVCNSCLATKRMRDRKRLMVEYKGGKCQLCGYDRCDAALSFHHRDPGRKMLQLARSYRLSWEIVKAELDKCDLLCVRCHIEVHAGLSSG